jgi:uncharacterized tellurite resistance protein B-like protein
MSDLSQMKLLINLAQIDGVVAEREQQFIINIGRANGIYPDEVRPLFDQQHPVIIPQNLTNDQKFDYIFSLVQLMKIDERMYKEEIHFCSKVAAGLGYNQQVMFDLLLHVSSAVMGREEVDELKFLTRRYLNA